MRYIILIGVLVVVFAGIGVTGIATWEYTNSDAFCSNACHNVHPEEPAAHQASQHSEVTCVECHIGRLGTFHSMLRKVGHTKHLLSLMTGYERPLTAPSMPASRESCEGCHSQQPHQHDSITFRRTFAPDRDNTETTVAVILRTAAESAKGRSGKGIHWHIENKVSYQTTDAAGTEIPWLEVTYADGSTKRYTDHSVSGQEGAGDSEIHQMTCMDCHNRSGHPFQDPEDVVDQALADGEINPELPFAKARAVELLKQKFTSREEAEEVVTKAWEQYKKDFPEVSATHSEWFDDSEKYMRERQKFALDMLFDSRFNDPAVNWRSFPDYSGHRYSPGCFRCHNGRHVDEQGTPIRVNCTLCHSVPVVMTDDSIPPYFLSILNMPKPVSHDAPDFTKTHRTAVDASCSACHGEISFGTDSKTFCANSGCHGQVWPGLDLRAGNNQLGAESGDNPQ